MRYKSKKGVGTCPVQQSGLALSCTGFTLIEAIVYLALFGIIMSGAVITAYQIVESSGRTETRAMVQEEGDFIVGKINWALSGIQSITAPATPIPGGACTVSNTLSVTKWDASIGNILITLSAGDVTLGRGGNQPKPLNNSNVTVTNLGFTHCYTGGINPESIALAFTVSALSPNGVTISQDFFTSNYVRK